jgi:hypothetical protein
MQAYPKHCPRAIIIPTIHCRPANLTRIYHSNICRQYCSTSHRDPAIASQKVQTNLLAIKNWFKKIENESQRMQVGTLHIHNTKINVPPGSYKQRATPPTRWCQVSRATPWQETYLAQTQFHKTETTRNHPHQSVLVTRTQVKTLYKQQTPNTYKTILIPIWTPEYNSGIWFPLLKKNLECFQSKALRMSVDASWYVPDTVIWGDLQVPAVKEEICRYSSQYSSGLSAHLNELTVHLMELPDNRWLRSLLPNDLPTRFLVWLLYL